jgi:uncharacterized membrane protein YgcG
LIANALPSRLTAWLRQFALFISAWFFVKVVVVISLQTFPFLSHFATWVLDPISRTGNAKLQVVVVMLLFPLVMNVVQAWLVDMVIKGKPLGDRQYMPDQRDEGDIMEDEEMLVDDASLHTSGGSTIAEGTNGLAGSRSGDGSGMNSFVGSTIHSRRVSKSYLDFANSESLASPVDILEDDDDNDDFLEIGELSFPPKPRITSSSSSSSAGDRSGASTPMSILGGGGGGTGGINSGKYASLGGGNDRK